MNNWEYSFAYTGLRLLYYYGVTKKNRCVKLRARASRPIGGAQEMKGAIRRKRGQGIAEGG